jgi:hypothetical protein
MKDYATNYVSMTDQHAQDYVKKSATVDQQLIALQEKYVPCLKK